MQHRFNRYDDRERSTACSWVALLWLLLLLLALLTGIFAFSDEELFFRRHLKQSDGADAMLSRVALEKTIPDASGVLSRAVFQTTDDPAVNFSGRRAENGFAIQDKNEVAPGSEFRATIRLQNLGDAPFGFWIEILPTDGRSSEEISDRLCVTLTTKDDGKEYIGDRLIVTGKDGGHIRRIGLGESIDLEVTVTVLAGEGEEDLSSFCFDFLVHTVGYERERPEMIVDLSDPTLYSVLPNRFGTIFDDFGNRYSYEKVERFPNGGTVSFEKGRLSFARITPGDKVSFTVDAENSGNLPLLMRIKIECLDGEALAAGLDLVIDGERQSQGITYFSEYLLLAPGEKIPTLALEIGLPITAGNEYQGLSCEIRITIEAVAVVDDELLEEVGL